MHCPGFLGSDSTQSGAETRSRSAYVGAGWRCRSPRLFGRTRFSRPVPEPSGIILHMEVPAQFERTIAGCNLLPCRLAMEPFGTGQRNRTFLCRVKAGLADRCTSPVYGAQEESRTPMPKRAPGSKPGASTIPPHAHIGGQGWIRTNSVSYVTTLQAACFSQFAYLPILVAGAGFGPAYNGV